jgi:predicted nucleic acid-binding protein
MTAPVFVDTNVLICAVDDFNLKKQEAARTWRTELWRSRRGRVSFQVLHEFYVNVTRKNPAAKQEARSEVRDLLAWRPVVIDEAVVEGAWKIQDRYQFSFWDALTVAAAKSASCGFLLTEDLPANRELDGLLVINPFQYDPASLPDR